VHDYIYTGIILIELLLHKGHLEPILLLIRCRSGADNEQAHQKHDSHIKNASFVMDIFLFIDIKENKKLNVGGNFAKLTEKYMTTSDIANIHCNNR
jgi:hypothetical protein